MKTMSVNGVVYVHEAYEAKKKNCYVNTSHRHHFYTYIYYSRGEGNGLLGIDVAVTSDLHKKSRAKVPAYWSRDIDHMSKTAVDHMSKTAAAGAL